jgi:large subunit ribosomal protein L9
MQVILVNNVPKLGRIGELVKVRNGFGRYLINSGKALTANRDNMRVLEEQKSGLEAKYQEGLNAAQARADVLSEVTLEISARASEEGKLFGSLGVTEIVEAFAEKGHTLTKKEVKLPEGPIRAIGEHKVHVQLHDEVMVAVTLNVNNG